MVFLQWKDIQFEQQKYGLFPRLMVTYVTFVTNIFH